MKKTLIALILIVYGVMFYQGKVLIDLSGHGIIALEFADGRTGAMIVSVWNSTPFGDGTLLSLARQSTHLDFLFILIYVATIATFSNARMQREKLLWLNELLRLNLFLAFGIGALDVVENIRLLHGFHHPGNADEFWTTGFLAWPKFVLALWAILVYFFSWIKSRFS